MNSTPSSFSQLQHDHIDLWSISPKQLNDSELKYLKSLITDEEQTRIATFKSSSAQKTSLVSRAMCRLVLSQYINIPAQAHQFSRNKHGKPGLLKNSTQLQFNLSHNEDLIIMAVSVKDEVGCDIENPTRKVSIEPITRRYFSTQEHAMLMAKQGQAQNASFFKTWTLKEAFVKATGVGIKLGLDSFYFLYDDKDNKQNIQVCFNEHYPLNIEQPWYCFHDQFQQQSFALCRATKTLQKICYLDAAQLIPVPKR
ncbi:4'-phosphopantetheinyl transferase superfamily protein [Psychromonas sp. 14N.309.X.WAT.B.A12]|uniref:4'-phosphopantetheinyl transferase family protein n=1 Tax=Psychromonas sp. 14N.309.X.WAT.B.A12 TaxID=2998322 RepID=UPI0025AF7589|nr:4'-phosphopantetheinyl transferase superfamily protein [Psychromonas sp. 14N.309.X.WAT.B.A12]MDN2662036.1 4'-phosphopantetheinyl transferase superfamily protein [Psychromonas sp. 14N.309.X.WAT.B.A12]